MSDKLLSVNEVSNYLNISKSSIYNYVKDQTIPSIRLNGRILFSKEAIESWISSNSNDVKPPSEAVNKSK